MLSPTDRVQTPRRFPGHAYLDEYLPPVVQHQHDPDEDGGQLQDGDLVPRGGHAAQAACGAGELGAHGGECVGLEIAKMSWLALWLDPMCQDGEDKGEVNAYSVVDDILGPRVVVDVNGHAAQGADLG